MTKDHTRKKPHINTGTSPQTKSVAQDNRFWFSYEVNEWYQSSDRLNNKNQLQKERDRKRRISKGRAANL